MKIRLLLIVLIATNPYSLWAQEISDGVLTVRLHPDIGRFSFFAETEEAGPVSLLFEPDPRTTTLSLLEGNRVHRMGGGGGFSRSVDAGPDHLTILWSSSTITVEQTVSLATTATGTATVRIRILNNSASAQTIAARYLIDTTYGESSAAHFRTASGVSVDSEYRMIPSASDSYWVSTGRDRSFFFTVAGAQTTIADSVVFANWKRLSETRWDYSASPGRSFSLVPFSINDSAAAVYYPSQLLDPGASREIVFLIGTGDGPRSSAVRAASIATTRARSPSPSTQPRSDLDSVNDLLREINRLLATDQTVSPDQVDTLHQRLRRIAPDVELPSDSSAGAR